MTPDDFARVLRLYCQRLGASVTSWGRTERHNATVGGDPRSLHVTWKAADVVYDVPIGLADRRFMAAQLGLYVHPEGDHDHIRAADEAWA